MLLITQLINVMGCIHRLYCFLINETFCLGEGKKKMLGRLKKVVGNFEQQTRLIFFVVVVKYEHLGLLVYVHGFFFISHCFNNFCK